MSSDSSISSIISVSSGRKIKALLKDTKLGIDILAYNLTDKVAVAIESAWIDLMGIENLENLVRGKGENIKRVPTKRASLIGLLIKLTQR